MPNGAEQQYPPPPSIPGLAWPGANDEPSGAEQSPAPAGSEPKRAEQSQSSYTPPPLTAEYLDVTGGCSGECSDCGNSAAPGATRCQRCIDHNPPQNYRQLRERYPELPAKPRLYAF